MAIAVISDFPGGTAEQDEARQRRMNVADGQLTAANTPKGALGRLAGPIEGGWRVISLFESQEDWEAFRREQLDPMFQQMGIAAPPVQIWPLHSFMIVPQQR
jgi:hypothetical protein